jgi:adenine-specific DNA-methyltransferase
MVSKRELTENQKKLLRTLKEMFQFDRSDLDFGIYRIMALKRVEILSSSTPAS